MDRADDIEVVLLSALDNALAMELKMSEDEATYDLRFISEKLALCSTFMERLSDLQLKLTRISMEVLKAERGSKTYVETRARSLKDSPDYECLPTSQKTTWVESQLADDRRAYEKWSMLRRMVSEVREAVSERVQTIRRLDSDIRLHSKLYEARVASGATAPGSFTGNSVDDIDI